MTYLGLNMADNVARHRIVTNGGAKVRTIFAPNEKLKMVQSRLRENILLKLPLPEYVHGFVVGKSLRTNAEQHQNSGLVINIDLKNFFPNISAKRVFGFWRWVFGGNQDLAWVCTAMTTFQDHLCQGFVTSPDIANHVAYKLDLRVAALAKSQGFRYTRYADDLTFSIDAYDGNCKWLIDAVTEIAKEEGFIVHPDKIAIMRPHRRQMVTGLVVNKVGGASTPPRIPRFHMRALRAMCDKGDNLRSPEDFALREGWLSYVHSVQPEKAAELRQLLDDRILRPKKKES